MPADHHPDRLSQLVATSGDVAATRSRKAKVARIAECLRGASPADASLAAVYLTGVLPQGKLGVGYALLRELRGTAAAASSTLRLREVDARFAAVKAEHGAGANARRRSALAELLARATAEEADFLVRLVAGELRQGALDGLVVDAVALAFAADVAATRRAVMFAGGIAEVASALAERGAAGLAAFDLTLFRPVLPMLADTADDLDSALARFGEAALEFKLDGARVQVHKDGERIEVYSRAGNVVTAAVPELVEVVAALPADRLVLDGEAIAFGAGGRPLPFQVTMRRFGRRLDVATLRRELPLDVRFFDVLAVDGEVVMDAPFAERWRALGELTGGTRCVEHLVTAEPAAAAAFLAKALGAGHEGIMIKGLAAPYEAGRRGQEWLKLKPVHTLDVVVLAAEWGSGRRAGRLSNLHLAARDPAGSFVMLGKTFKGMTDAVLQWQTAELLARETGRDGHVVFVRPELVVEIAFDGVQRSSYPGGVALRFARLVRYRDDKTAADASTIDEVRALLPVEG
ncbi:MAG: ATP-dependent DNA ligase [Planctomycetes bacterium]|nr:ATP-dependent DNA ligase [Planctomycetota bacterium]